MLPAVLSINTKIRGKQAQLAIKMGLDSQISQLLHPHYSLPQEQLSLVTLHNYQLVLNIWFLQRGASAIVHVLGLLQ